MAGQLLRKANMPKSFSGQFQHIEQQTELLPSKLNKQQYLADLNLFHMSLVFYLCVTHPQIDFHALDTIKVGQLIQRTLLSIFHQLFQLWCSQYAQYCINLVFLYCVELLVSTKYKVMIFSLKTNFSLNNSVT